MNKSTDLPNLDFLRASAVLMVLSDHVFQAVAFTSVRVTWFGRLGVLLFFVHTACVLMMSLERHKGGSLTLAFYVRRFFRIYPLSVAGVLAAWLCRGGALDVREWLANLALVQNLFHWRDAFGSIWSLPLEVQMYLFLPGLFLLASRSRTVFPILALWVSTFLAAAVQSLNPSHLNLLTFAPCFVPGILAWTLISRSKPRFPGWAWPPTLAILVLAFEISPNWTYSAWFTCLALGLVIPLFGQLSNRPLNRVTFILAKYSYGIYVGHSILLLVAWPRLATLPFFLAGVAVLAWLAYHLIENPMIQLGKILIARKFSNVGVA